MDIQEIRARLDELGETAKARMRVSAPDFAGAVGGAEIDFMTDQERAERHKLVMMLPSSFEEAQAAKARIQVRIAQRRSQTTKPVDLDGTVSRFLLREATSLVRKAYPAVKIRRAWTYHFHQDHWEFHGPDGFYWDGRADGAYHARYQGWMAWLKTMGVSKA
ncbi:hypothetical protein [Noviherbaspirillum galbum]|uniref:Uncharacterized protein n=1 Tax=Noviherbaspirillum galbum TaxID=2709383 RepID=A0A6B3SLB7_9BURK|nr:hypothetical protein [Noviherbaspirillum galbum]NEX60165.1 hypothetical protein [Noviherbaspirillum galbum]